MEDRRIHHEPWVSFTYSRPIWLPFPLVRPPLFWSWEGPVTPPGPAVALTDRNDLHLTKTKQEVSNYPALVSSLFGLIDLHLHQQGSRSDIREWCATCWLQQNDTAAHTVTSASAGPNGNPAAVISRLTDRSPPVRRLQP